MLERMNSLYILPFDHRGSFVKLFGYAEADLAADIIEKLSDYKHIIYEGFLGALKLGVPKEAAAILVDEQFGRRIHEEARALMLRRILAVEKSGQDEFDFEYGKTFGEHVEALTPEYVKALVRYNPRGDKEINRRQCARLKMLNDFCKTKKYKFLFELLAAPTQADLAETGSMEAYELNARFKAMSTAIAELQGAGIEPDVWKVEGLENAEQMRMVVAAARAGGRGGADVVVLGRGENEERVKAWLAVAAKIEGIIGFAVGRTVFAQPLLDYHARRITREEAARAIAVKYHDFVEWFDRSRGV